MATKEFPTQQVLELACAAQRVNGSYIKEGETVYAADGVAMHTIQPNKILMLYTLDDTKVIPNVKVLKITPEDIARAEEIQTYYKRLIFAAIEGDNEFLTKIHSLLGSESVKENEFGWVACLPSVQSRDVAQSKVKRAARSVEDGYLADIGAQLSDLDAEIIESNKSKNFEAYNICAIINNRMCSWLNKTNLNLGACVIIKAKVKDHAKHWKHNNDVTRLNYVKAAQ